MKNRRPTPAQDAARMRNFGIRNLRALYALAHQLKSPRREAVHALIDEELVARGALPTREHRKAMCAEADKRSLKALQRLCPPAIDIGEDEIPF